jgi:alpha-L-arabinofuranosidase
MTRHFHFSRFGIFLLPAIFCLAAPWGLLSSSGQERFEVEITPRTIVTKPVSPLIYGNFIELGLGHQVDRMWAELLWNRSFEDVAPYKLYVWDWLSRQPSNDLTKEAWWHSGYEENGWYIDAANPEASMRPRPFWGFRHGVQSIDLRNGSKTQWAVLAQNGIYLRKGLTYHFSGWLGTGQTAVEIAEKPVGVKVGLYPEGQFGNPLAEKELVVTGGIFREFQADFEVADFEGRASFALSVEPGGRVVTDAFSLFPSDNVRGWRKEVVEAMKRVRPPIVRFPGGCFASFYNWRDGIGPGIDRNPREPPYWGGLENNDVGVAELASLCREVGAEPFYCLNLMTGTAEEAAALVAYCNAGRENPMGALRVRHGYPEPFGIRYWELDNEIMRRFGALEYAARCVEFSRAVKAIDPTVKLVMIGYGFERYLGQMLEIAGEWIDGITDRALAEDALRRDLEVIGTYNRAHDRSIFLCNTEWLARQTVMEALPGARLDPGEELVGTLQNKEVRWGYAMTAVAELLLFQRLGGDFLFANFNNLANTWGQNVIECAMEGVWLSAAGRAFELMTRSPAAWPLAHSVKVGHPNIIFQSAWNKDKRNLVLQILNFGGTRVEALFDLRAIGFRAREAEVSTLWADSLQAQNTLANPEAVRRADRTENVKNVGRFRWDVPPRSVCLIVLKPK